MFWLRQYDVNLHQWCQLRRQGGRRPPQDFQNDIFFKNFYWFYWFNVQYVHAYQDLVPFSTWIDFNIGVMIRVFGMTAQKFFFLCHKKFCPPKKFVNWRYWSPSWVYDIQVIVQGMTVKLWLMTMFVLSGVGDEAVCVIMSDYGTHGWHSIHTYVSTDMSRHPPSRAEYY